MQGVFSVVHADPTDDRSQPYLETTIANERDPSQSTAIAFPKAVIDRYGGIDALESKRVAVRAVAPTRGRDRGALTATAIDVQGDASRGVPLAIPAGSTGTPKPVLTVLCRFKDQPAQPQMQPYFDGLAGPNSLMDTYFRQTSYQQINLDGSAVAPAGGNWYQLPNNQADYIDDNGKMRLGKLYNECTALATQQENLDDFAIIQLAFNTNLVSYSFGGFYDGRKVTWLPPKGWQKGGTVAHELGHAVHMDHTGLAGRYDNQWDVLSSSGSACTPHPVYTCLPKHQSAYNKNEGARWLPGMVFDREKMFTGNWCDNNDNCTQSKVPEAFDFEIDGIRIRVDSISATKATVTFTQLPRIATLQAGETTTSSYQLKWADTANTETFFKILFSNQQTSGEVIVPANTTSYTFHNAPAGKDFTHMVQACNSLGCGPGGNQVSTGADPLPLKQK